MARRGEFKWICGNCKAESFFERRELIRAARPKCPACGSLFLTPATKEASKRLALSDIARREQHEEIERRGGIVR